jgi:hypothetical protein
MITKLTTEHSTWVRETNEVFMTAIPPRKELGRTFQAVSASKLSRYFAAL